MVEFRKEGVTAYILQNFQFGMEPLGGRLLIRLLHKDERGKEHWMSYLLDFERELRFARELAHAIEEAQRFRSERPERPM